MVTGLKGTFERRAHDTRRAILVMALTLIIGIQFIHALPTTDAAYAPGKETRVTWDMAEQYCPDIYGNRIIWNDFRNSNWDIFLYDLNTSTETRITQSPSTEYFQDISGARIAFEDYRNGNSDIYMYDLDEGTEIRVTTDPDPQILPDIDGDRIVWEDQRNNTCEIYLYNLDEGTERRITSNSPHQYDVTRPGISGDRIVWEDSRNCDYEHINNYDIYMYDLGTGNETQVTTDTATQTFPAISGNRIVWQDERNGNLDIYMYDIDTGEETQITTDTASQSRPAISGSRIVWQDERNGNSAIYMFDLDTSTETQITTDMGYHCNAAIHGNRTVWQDERNGNGDIYMFETPSKPPRWSNLDEFDATEDIQETVDLAAFCLDPDTPPECLVLTSTSPYVTSIDGLLVSVLFPDGVLEASVSMGLSDGWTVAMADVNFTVTPVNDAPRFMTVDHEPITTDPVSFEVHQGSLLVIIVGAEDLEGDELVFSVNSTLVDVNATSGAMRVRPDENTFGILRFALTMYDVVSPLVKVRLNFSVSIINVNDPLGEVLILNPREGEAFKVNLTFSLIGICTDPDTPQGQVLMYTWYWGEANLIGYGSSHTMVFTAPGSYTIRLTVSDGEFEASDSVNVTIVSDLPDADADGIADPSDDFPVDPAASIDTDKDGFPDAWNTGMSINDSLSVPRLRLDAFPHDPAASLDTDWDGYPDEWNAGRTQNDSTTVPRPHLDAFPLDLAASLDTDRDGRPDAWNSGRTVTDTTSGLELDRFPVDSAASIDTDDDGHPDSWNPGRSSANSTTGLELDYYPYDALRWEKETKRDTPSLSMVVVLGGFFFMTLLRAHRRRKTREEG